jgi:hypothetical protein
MSLVKPVVRDFLVLLQARAYFQEYFAGQANEAEVERAMLFDPAIKPYKRHTGESRYAVALEPRNCWFGLDSGSSPE